MRRPQISAALVVATAAFAATPAMAKVSAEEAAKLGKELTPIGAERAGNADGTIPEWKGGVLFSQFAKDLKRDDLEKWRTETPEELEKLIFNEMEKAKEQLPEGFDPLTPEFTITKANYREHADKLTVGHQKMFELYDTYKMNIYPSVRTGFFPDEIYEATKKNATTAVLEGTDGVKDAVLGFPFPIPKQGAEVIWNHKLKFRGSAVKRFNNQAIVAQDGDFKLSKLVEDVKFKYANLDDQSSESNKLIAYYLQEVTEPPRVAGQITLVHETADQSTSGRNAWLYDPGLGRTRRAPNVGYDNPSLGSDGEQFNDQIDVFNGALDRYNWKLVGKKELYIPYNSGEVNSPLHSYKKLLQKGHINQDLARYELHRVWVVEATLRDGVRHNFKKRVFYVDEDSWSTAAVDCYDNRDQLWKLQEAHLITFPFIPTVTGSPELIYDLQTGRYFATAMVNEDPVSDFDVSYEDRKFLPQGLARQAGRR